MSNKPDDKKSQEEQSSEGQRSPSYSSTGRLLKPGMGLEGDAVQPKTVKKLITRFAILMAILAVFFFGLQWVLNQGKDLGSLGSVNSAGWISAVEYYDRGSQAIYLDANGVIHKSSGYEDEVTDNEPVWSPDGNFLYFVSNREIKGIKQGANNIYRWNLDKGLVEARTYDTRSKGTPIFDNVNTPESNNYAIVMSGMTVDSFTPSEKSMSRLLPPITRELGSAGQGEEGGANPFVAVYGRFGDSFKQVLRSNDKRYMVAVMRAADGDVLIVQLMDGEAPPRFVIAGRRIDIEKNPANGDFYVIMHEPYVPEFQQNQIVKDAIEKGEKPTLPQWQEHHWVYRLAVGEADVQMAPLIPPLKDDTNVWNDFKPSPDGQYFLVTVGDYKGNGIVDVKSVWVGNDTGFSVLINSPAYDLSWSPDSNKILYTKLVGDKRDIFVINRDGSNETNLTKGKGDFGKPRFSPQLPK
ncbi:MAG: PD40 domain-containing protein [Fimbriimonadaceae bacterium]|nr:PD40 domain-containing protein [Fimbriimonadaceae bacterium]